MLPLTLLMILGLPSMDRKTFSKCLDNLAQTNENVKEEVLKASTDIAHKAYFEQNLMEKNDDSILNVTVSYDG